LAIRSDTRNIVAKAPHLIGFAVRLWFARKSRHTSAMIGWRQEPKINTTFRNNAQILGIRCE